MKRFRVGETAQRELEIVFGDRMDRVQQLVGEFAANHPYERPLIVGTPIRQVADGAFESMGWAWHWEPVVSDILNPRVWDRAPEAARKAANRPRARDRRVWITSPLES